MVSPGADKAGRAYVERTLGDRLGGGFKGDERRLKVFAAAVRNVGRRITAVSAATAARFAAAGPLGRGSQA